MRQPKIHRRKDKDPAAPAGTRHVLGKVYDCPNCGTSFMVVKSGNATNNLICCDKPIKQHRYPKDDYLYMPEDK